LDNNTIYLIRNTIEGSMIYFDTAEEADEYLTNMELRKGEVFEKYIVTKGKNIIPKPNSIRFVAYYSTSRYDVGIVGVYIIDQNKINKTIEFPSFKNDMGRKFIFTLELLENESKEDVLIRAEHVANELLEKEYNSNYNFKEYVNKQILESEGVI